jgi:hypothetical protein
VTAGLPLIWAGTALGWHWVRNFWFRAAHLGAILFVAAEALLGLVCPLTEWENALRGGPAQEAGFIAHWVRRLLFWDFPPWVFTAMYVAFALAVLATFLLAPPDSPRRNRR